MFFWGEGGVALSQTPYKQSSREGVSFADGETEASRAAWLHDAVQPPCS